MSTTIRDGRDQLVCEFEKHGCYSIGSRFKLIESLYSN